MVLFNTIIGRLILAPSPGQLRRRSGLVTPPARRIYDVSQ